MRATGINHVSISAPDLDASIRFYMEIFGMEQVPAPRFPDQPVAWLALGDQQLHLFQRDLKVRELEIRDDATFMGGILELPGGEAQMYLRDPAGNLVEVDWPDAALLDRDVVRDIVRLADLVPQDAQARTARLYGAAARAARTRAAAGESKR
jgi:catechol 2,3-dioxygenase-like lactoylglutathione lyase family enzyme